MRRLSDVLLVSVLPFLVPFGSWAQANSVPAAEPAMALASSGSPAGTISLGAWEWAGDLRYRLTKTREDIDDARPYHQLRARLGFKGKIQDNVGVQFRLASGTSAISQNQTLGDSKEPGMPRRSFGLDLAYADWNFGAPGRLWIGREPNPFFSPGQSQMLLDADLAFEGFSYKWEKKDERAAFFFNTGAFMISENYGAPPPPLQDIVDTGLVGAQLGVAGDLGIGTLTWHLGTLQYVNIQDKVVATVDKDAKTDPYSYPFDRFKGNTIYPDDPFAAPDVRKYYFQNQFVIYESGLEFKVPLAFTELGLFYYYSKNPAAPELNTAQEAGASLKWGRVALLVAQNKKESDSVVGAFTDSDFNGGGTDNRGEKIGFSYKLSGHSSFVLTSYRGERGIDSVQRIYEATQADFNLTF